MPDQYRTPREHLRLMAEKYRVDPELAMAILQQESGGRQSDSADATGQPRTSPQGARGFFQLLPRTAYGEFDLNPDDPFQNIEAGVRYLRQAIDRGNHTVGSIASYYHGGPNQAQWGPKTTAYAQAIEAALRGGPRDDTPDTPAAPPDPAKVARANAVPLQPGSIPPPEPRPAFDYANRIPARPSRTPRPFTPGPGTTIVGAAADTPEQSAVERTATAQEAGFLHRGGMPASGVGYTPDTTMEAFWSRHPYLAAAADALDPAEREGRQNLAGTIGGIAGGALGGTVGTVAGAVSGAGSPAEVATIPAGAIWGRRVGSAIGAGLAGGAEQLAIEETGLGSLLDRLPWHNVAEPPPSPDSNILQRTGSAMGTQAVNDVGGQLIGKGVGMVLKRTGIQQAVSRNAARAFEAVEKAREGKLELFKGARDALVDAAANMRLRGDRLKSAVADWATWTGRNLSDKAARETADLAATTEARVGQARDLAASAKLAAEQAMGKKIAGHEADAAAAEAAANARAQTQIGAPPPEIPVGESVGAVVANRQGPVQTVKNALGAEVRAAAKELPVTDITKIGEEATRIAEQDLLPQEVAFPRQLAEPADDAAAAAAHGEPTLIDTGITDNAGNPIMRPGPPAPAPPPPPPATGLDALNDRIQEAELDDVVKSKVMQVITRIRNAVKINPKVPGEIVHLWKSELQDAINHDPTQRSRAEAITAHLTGLLRDAIHSPRYDAATAAYAPVAKLLEEGNGPEIIRTILQHQPEKVVQMISVDDPSATRMLVDLLTHVAGQAGEEGAALGKKALGQVQEAWLHRNVLRQGINGLADRLQQLTPEFRAALFGNSEGKAMLDRAAQMATEHENLLTSIKLDLAEKTAAEKLVPGKTAAEGKAIVEGHQRAGKEAARKLEASQLWQQRASEGKTGAVKEATSRYVQDQRAELAQRLRDIRRMIAAGKTPSPEARAFLDSTLSPQEVRRTEQTAADVFNAIISPSLYYKGLSMVRLLKGASDKDLLLYAAKSPGWTQFIVNNLITSRKPGLAIAQGIRVGAGAYRVRQDTQRAGTPPPPPPGR